MKGAKSSNKPEGNNTLHVGSLPFYFLFFNFFRWTIFVCHFWTSLKLIRTFRLCVCELYMSPFCKHVHPHAHSRCMKFYSVIETVQHCNVLVNRCTQHSVVLLTESFHFKLCLNVLINPLTGVYLNVPCSLFICNVGHGKLPRKKTNKKMAKMMIYV